MQWLVPDVPKHIQNKIDHERFIDQRERWASQTNKDNFESAIPASKALAKLAGMPNGNTTSPNRSNTISSSRSNSKSPNITNTKSPTRQPNRRGHIRIKISPEYEQ